MVDERKRGGVYARQSHGKQASVDDQLRAGRARCAALDADVAWEGRDKVSASRFGTKERDDWPRLVAAVAAGELDLVWLWDASRGDRTPESWFPFLSRCRERGVRIYSERDERAYDVRIPRDWKSLADAGVDAAYDSEIKTVDVRRGIAGAALAGKQHGPVQDGYDRLYDERDRRQFTQVPNDRAPIIKEIIERVAGNDPIIVIEQDLNERGVWTAAAINRLRRGVNPHGPICERGCRHPSCWAIRGRWRRNSIRKVARNPAYAGLRDHNGATYEGNWPAIIDLDTWYAAQAVLNDETRKTTAPGSYKWLLSYIASGPCGNLVRVLPSRRGRKNRNARYHCQEDGCTSIDMWSLDEYVSRLVLARSARPDARRMFERSDKEGKAARTERIKLERELEEWRASADEPGGISAIALARKERALLPLIEKARQRIVDNTAPAAALSLITATETERGLVRPRWDAMSVAARRSVVNAWIEKIMVRPTEERLTRWSTSKERLEVAARRTQIRWRGELGDAQVDDVGDLHPEVAGG